MKKLIKLWRDSYWITISVATMIVIPAILAVLGLISAAICVFIFGVAHFLFALAYSKYLKLKGE